MFEIKEPNVYNGAEVFSAKQYFFAEYGFHPNTFGFKVVNSHEKWGGRFVDVKKFITKISEKYTESELEFNKNITVCANDPDKEDEMMVYVHIKHRMIVMYITPKIDTCCIFTELEDKEQIKDLIDLILESVVEPPEEVHLAKLSLINSAGSGFRLTESTINPIEVDINRNYNNDFSPINDIVDEFLNSRGSGLIILHGLPGTGKTSYIRHLINKYDKQFVYVTQEIASNLSSPNFVTFCLEQLKGSILILEDCESLLKSRECGNRNTGISDLLDMTDGLLSDIFNIKFICTFNEDIKNIDKALLRKGRLHCKYEFQKLVEHKAIALADYLNLDSKKIVGDTSLADIYNLEKMGFDTVVRKRIGF
jgi:hypothetical protein